MGFVNVGPLELLVIAIIALIVLGPARLPEAARSVGKGVREFRDSLSGEPEREERYEDDDEDDEDAGEPDEPLERR